ncbi:hypothetical protein SNE40_018502 [Patella caerulea]|uniref:SCP domain-containing protein n=1 Tax=Patella caerulea TaxID=87958 RepID=A0AAN8J5P2_PATCE
MQLYFVHGLTVLGIAICCYAATMQKREACEYAGVKSTHTMCIEKNVGEEVPVDDVTQKEIIDKHNTLRAGVNPSAGRMPEVIWDGELAQIALKWAQQCVFGHDENDNRRTKAYPSVDIGQNCAYDTKTWTQAIDNWYSEVSSFKYGTGSVDGEPVGHYTQVVNDNAVRVGCGQAKCPVGSSVAFKERSFVCNYGRGQYSFELKRPYVLDNPCDDCPGHCDKELNLCYCNGMLCQNGGRMDYSTCKCNCTTLYTGNECSQIDCKPDSHICPLYKVEWCQKYTNVPQECPKKCKVC